ncbi:MAG: hypothetical protein B7C24_10270 [Bacteroidetes bacterium 4572_77]|nr:MAG: hypothetical protein B7C24_10270 [Bacteroidetes bacterium 4572_77]
MKHIFWSIFLLGILTNTIAQEGCTDQYATNYNQDAQINDGSCVYEPLFLRPQVLIENLPVTINETSGLIDYKDGLWTHNDSGGEAKIYKFSKATGEITQTISINNVTNVDIEDITQDEHYIYVGDFGNNKGNRDDLQIYKLHKEDIPESANASIDAEIIAFSYSDQVSFDRKNRKNDYDCEAFLSFEDHLYLFSKNWASETTKCYKLSKSAGEYEISILDTFNVRGLITAADYNAEKNRIVLLGYENFIPFMWTIWDFNDDDFFKGHKKRADFAYIAGAQTEGVCFKSPSEVYISCEESYYPQQLYQLDIDQIVNGIENADVYQRFDIQLFPNPAKQNVRIEVIGLNEDLFDVEIYNINWQKINQFSFQEKPTNGKTIVDAPLNNIKSGIYFIKIRQAQNVGFQKLMIRK